MTGAKKLTAYQLSLGAESRVIQRYMAANQNNTWQQLKEQLAVRFSDVTDRQTAFSLLRTIKQKIGICRANFIFSGKCVPKSRGI